jgi:integral membrane protein (TIGR01906 family)
MTPPRAHPLIGFVFAVGVALAILLTGPMLLFAPPFVSFMQDRHGVPELLGVEPAAAHGATTAMLGDLLTDGDFTVSLDGTQPVLDASERSHMSDVGAVVRGLLLANVLALVVALLGARRLRAEPYRRGRLMLVAAGGLATAAIVLGAFFALAFDTAFAAFHAIFFEAGTWQFGPDSNLLRFFPEPFWFEMALIAGATIVLGALVVALLARRDLARQDLAATRQP